MQKRPADGPSRFELRVARVDPGRAMTFRFLSAHYGGILTHYVRGGTVYCPGSGCPANVHRERRFWKGYAAAELWDVQMRAWLPCIPEITEHCELDLRNAYRRGQVWQFGRLPQTGKHKSPVTARLVEELDPASVPPAFDYLPTLQRLYHCVEIDLSVKNPMPLKVFVEPSAGAPPANAAGPVPDVQDILTPQQISERLRAAGHARPSNGIGN